MHESEDKKMLLRRGVIVFVGLAVLTGVEFWVAVGGLTASLPLLGLMAIGKTALIVEYYMHLRGVFEPDEGGH
jgi:heme/copper-type cytochrome/quinol oxidase subunit 4